MKKLIVLALLFPLVSFASGDGVSIVPITPVCGTQTIPVTVNAQYRRNNRHLVTYLDGQKINHYNNEPGSVTETITVGPGVHQFKARIYLVEINANSFLFQLASDSQTFTVNECEQPPVVVDVCPNIEGDQAVVPEGFTLTEGQCIEDVIEVPPTDVCPNIEGVQEDVPDGKDLVEGQCVDQPLPPVSTGGGSQVTSRSSGSGSTPSARLCYLTGGRLCFPWDQVTSEMNNWIMQQIEVTILDLQRQNAK